MELLIKNKKIDMLRSFSFVFTRSVFKEIIEYQDFSRIDNLIEQYELGQKGVSTYQDVIRKMYRVIRNQYCCEYVYKNEFLTRILIQQYGTAKTVAFNEFKVPPSIVDIALFNGESKAFEIKTEYDTPKRLYGQIANYTNFFDKCYLIIPEALLTKYLDLIELNIGILLLSQSKSSIKIFEYRDASNNDSLSVELVMRVLHTQEYKNIIKSFFGEIPPVSCFEMFEQCQDLMKDIPTSILRTLILGEIKKRRNNTCYLKHFPNELRQIALSLNLNHEEMLILKKSLEKLVI